MHDIFIDIETFSSVDLKSSGLYKYIESDDFEILLVSYAIDDGPVICIDLLSGEEFPEEFEEALFDPHTTKHAHNVVFERNCFKRIGYDIPVEQWECTMVKAAYCGLPFSLDQVCEVLEVQNKKLKSGTLLIKYFSCPCKPSKTNGMRPRNYPENAPDKWEMYKEYNMVDVEAEREIYYALRPYDWPEIEKKLYALDQAINTRGVKIDTVFAESCIKISAEISKKMSEDITDITGITNPNSDAQVKAWIKKVTGLEIPSLAKDVIGTVLEQFKGNELVSYVLETRNLLSKSSVKKYEAMIACAGSESRARGLVQFYGGNRTGRWAGRLIQVQNLPQNHIADLDYARELTRLGDTEMLDIAYGKVPMILSQLIRTAFIAKEDHTFVVADFSAIEARVISWYAEESWRIDVFNTHGKIYEATAARMFNLPLEMITKGSDLRQKGKIAELALGFGGSLGALERMGGAKMGLTESEMKDIVKKWRRANPSIVEFWAELESAAVEALTWTNRTVEASKGLKFLYDGQYLTIELPAGRKLFYANARLRSGKYNKPTIIYEGLDQETKKWSVIDTYGGKLSENIVQATARDLLAYSMLKIQEANIDIVMHIHDEVVTEVPKINSDVIFKQLCAIMGTEVPWAIGLPLRADGYCTDFYKKD